MKKKILGLSLLLGTAAVALASCGTNNAGGSSSVNTESSSTTTTELKQVNYTVTIEDFDGSIFEASIRSFDNTSVLEDLKSNFNVVSTSSSNGTYLVSINDTLVDSNYYLAIYENGVSATTGVDGLHKDNGDQFKFKVECWNTVESGYGTMDATDLLVDKALYGYAKDYLSNTLGNIKTFTGTESDYWTFMMLSKCIDAGLDSNIFNTTSVTTELKQALASFDLSTLSGAAYGKYYYTARAIGQNLDTFKSQYTSYLETVTEYGAYGEYTRPFDISPAYTLGLTASVNNDVINTTYAPSTGWGYDGYTWFATSQALFGKFTKEDLSVIPTTDQGNAVSTAALLLPYAALGDVENGHKIAKVLLDNYYDDGIILYDKKGTYSGLNYMSNQVYAALAMYKLVRDSKTNVNIFA